MCVQSVYDLYQKIAETRWSQTVYGLSHTVFISHWHYELYIMKSHGNHKYLPWTSSYAGGPQIHRSVPKIIMKMGTRGPQNFMTPSQSALYWACVIVARGKPYTSVHNDEYDGYSRMRISSYSDTTTPTGVSRRLGVLWNFWESLYLSKYRSLK